MKKLLLACAFLSLTPMFAQELEGENLIENGSFESIEGKVMKLGDIVKATGWLLSTPAKPDLYKPDKKVLDINPTSNPYGSEEPKDGENFAGIVTFSYNDKLPRTYLMTKLNKPMLKGQKYCVNFYVSLAELSKYASNNIGIHFDKKPLEASEKVSLLSEFDVLNFNNKVFNATYNWDKVCATYVAKGGEKYLILGNFETNEATKYESMRKQKGQTGSQIIAAYYYVDDIKVQLLGDEEKCDCGVDEGRNLGSTVIYSKNDYFRDDMTITEKVKASTIYFGFAQSDITEASNVDLDRLVKLMKENPNLKLKVTGNSDLKETELAKEKPNYAGMSQKRINSTIKYFMDKGIDDSRFVPSDAGDRTPAESSSEADEELIQAKNRRVEFSVY
jgi:outer membrane protein OmpA-like peptidoglycan-associated protein